MKRIVLISDIHIDWTSSDGTFEENRVALLSQEVQSHKPDEVWIIGDLLDKARSNVETLKLVRDFIDSLRVPTYYLEGNHERLSAEKYTLTQLKKLFNIEKLPNRFNIEGVDIVAIGHDSISQIVNEDNADILLSHFRWTHPVYGKGEIFKDEITIKNKFKEIILGDIHSSYSPHKNVRYIRSPYTINYQKESDTGILVIDFNNGKYAITPVDTNLPNKIKINIPVNKLAKLLATLDDTNRYFIDVLLNSKEELKMLSKVHKPHCVKVLRPIIEDEKISDKKVEIKDDVFETFLSVADSKVRESKDMIKEIVE